MARNDKYVQGFEAEAVDGYSRGQVEGYSRGQVEGFQRGVRVTEARAEQTEGFNRVAEVKEDADGDETTSPRRLPTVVMEEAARPSTAKALPRPRPPEGPPPKKQRHGPY